MKSAVLTIIYCFLVTIASAQWSNKYSTRWSKESFLYVSGDLMVGNYNGGDISFNYIYDSKFSVKVGFSASNKEVSLQSLNGLKAANLNSFSNYDVPAENFENFHLLLGRVFTLPCKRKIRVNLQGGPGISTIRNPQSVDIVNGGRVNYNIKNAQYVSLIVNPKVEFPLAYLVGMSVGPKLIVNKERLFFGLGIGFMYGVIDAKSN